jgi:uncharacterized protein
LRVRHSKPRRLAAAFGCFALAGCASRGPDPVAADPVAVDPAHPAALGELSLQSEGSRMNGIVYVAAGAGPHPTVVLLHGYPGNERNLDLAQALRRDGWDVVFFHYRGAWGSRGEFSFENARADVAAVLRTVRSPEFAAAQRADPRHVALVGHSMGGFLALMTASEDPAVECAASLAGANLGLLGRALAADPEQARAAAQRFDAWSGPIHGFDGALAAKSLAANANAYDLLRRAPLLAEKHLLLVAGTRDTDTPIDVHHRPLVAALRAAGAAHLEEQTLPSDHAFSDARIALTRTLIAWLDAECR